MNYFIRIMGYDIKIDISNECDNCHKRIKPIILGSVLDNDKLIRYALALKCPSCNELSFVTYNIGKEQELSLVEEQSKSNPIKPINVNNVK